jgi:hypothetical protein
LTKERNKKISEYLVSIINDLELWLDIKRVLLDRGFCSNDIIEFLELRGLEYVITSVWHFDIKEAANVIESTVKEIATESGFNVKDKYKLGKCARRNKLDEFYVDSVSTGKNPHPTRFVAVYVRQRTNNKDPLKRWIYCLFLYVTNMKC